MDKKLCECGCGSILKRDNMRFKQGHNLRKLTKEEINELSAFQKILIQKRESLIRRIKDMVVDQYIPNSYFHLLLEAQKRFAKNNCFICDCELIWNNETIEPNSGRMFNFDGSEILHEDRWVSICVDCLQRRHVVDIIVKYNYEHHSR